MEDTPEIAKIDLTGDRLKVPHSEYGNVSGIELVESLDDAPFLTSIQAAIWRVDVLLRFLNDAENPWQFEKKGGGRMKRARTYKKSAFTGKILGTSTPLLTYINAVGGEGAKPGEYDFSKFPIGLGIELGLIR
jgi:hypothetical protein